MQVSIVGSSEADENEYDNARKIGELLAKREVTVICGGGKGVMEAVAKGVQSGESGRIIGIRPESHPNNSNSYLDDVIVTGIGYARNLSVVLSGESVIAVGGNYGTLTEIAYARKYEKDIFGVGTWKHPRFDFPSSLSPEEAVERACKSL